MKKFILKTGLYTLMVLLALEATVRVLHLYTEDPPRLIDELGVEKRVPDHQGYAVTGNRNQNFSKFKINRFGFNSRREFLPTNDKFEIALIGDSFIEGFHQDYYNSIGTKIENKLSGTEVYEFGYAGYDLANQLHLVNAYKDKFELIDEIIIYLNYENDLSRGIYEPNHARIKMLSSTLFKIRDNIKLLAYGSKIGVLEPFKRMISGNAFARNEKGYRTNEIDINEDRQVKKELERLNNFKNLVDLYGFDKRKTVILLDSRKTEKSFIDYCKSEDIEIVDFAGSFKKSKKPTTLIYDRHWNNHGRELVAKEITEYIKTSENYTLKY